MTTYYDVPDLVDAVKELAWQRWICLTRIANGAGEIPFEPMVVAQFQKLGKCLRNCCASAELQGAVDRIDGPWRTFVCQMSRPMLALDAMRELDILLEIIQPELSRRYFCFVPAEKAKGVLDVENNTGSWALVWSSFPSVRKDISEAVYSRSHGLDTACVFHLMRAAEIGLRALGRHAKAKFKKGPLEWQQWGDILSEIGKRAASLKLITRGPKKDELLDFYNSSLAHFSGFKDEYRNNIMHVRDSYDQFQSARCLSQVHSFMLKLSRRINERGKLIKK